MLSISLPNQNTSRAVDNQGRFQLVDLSIQRNFYFFGVIMKVFNRDNLTNFRLIDLARMCFSIINEMQNDYDKKELQALAPSIVAVLIARELGVHPPEILQIAENVLKYGERENNEHIMALVGYVRGELR